MGAAMGMVLLLLFFFFPGYLLLSFAGKFDPPLRLILSFIFGIAAVTTVCNLCARASGGIYFFYFVVLVSAAGIFAMVLRNTFWREVQSAPRGGREITMAGCAAALIVAPFLWRSGRFSGGDFVFYGPAGKDPLFHVTLLQRLLFHIPPDNFIVAGLRAPVYHYFGDLALALILIVQHSWHGAATNLFDLYFRCYPAFLYFLLGALAFQVGRQVVGSTRGGILGMILLLGGGGFGWALGLLQTLFHAGHPAVFRSALFSSWTTWDGVDSILPLVHRPAHYHGLLFSLAAIAVLLRPHPSRRDWALAGLLLGLMSGFNFTLAASFGVMAVAGAMIFGLRRERAEALNLSWFAGFLFVGSLPVLSAMLLSGFHENAPGFPFSGPNLQFPVSVWGPVLGHVITARLIPLAALIMLPIFAYGFRLFGLRAMAHLDLGDEDRRSLAMVLALVFVLSFLVGVFFPYNAFGGESFIFIQPSIWIMALFAIRPIDAWLTRQRGGWAAVAVWSVLALTWIQALASFNFAQRAEFSREAARALQDLHATADHEDVVAYLPDDLTERPILGDTGRATNFAILAMTGLDGYFSNEPYSIFFAVPGLSGTTSTDILARARRLYHQRVADVNSFISGNLTDAARDRLQGDHVRWIVISGQYLQNIPSSPTPWRNAGDLVIYRLSP